MLPTELFGRNIMCDVAGTVSWCIRDGRCALLAMAGTVTGCVVCAEIGATAKAPVERTLKYGIAMGYCTIVSAYLTVSITGETHAHSCLRGHPLYMACKIMASA